MDKKRKKSPPLVGVYAARKKFFQKKLKKGVDKRGEKAYNHQRCHGNAGCQNNTILENDTERNKKNKQSDSKMSESPFGERRAKGSALARMERSEARGERKED